MTLGGDPRREIPAEFGHATGEEPSIKSWRAGRKDAGRRIVSHSAQVQAIYRYPVKGLSGEPLERTQFMVGKTVPCDRLYAIENGHSGFDPATPVHLQKTRFLMLMRNERLAELRTTFDEGTHTLIVRLKEREVVRGDLRTPQGRALIEQFFAQFCASDLRGAPKMLSAPDHSFSDVARKVVSVINLASVAELENAIGAPLNPLRFRGNLYVNGWPAWRELNLLGREIGIGPSARLKILKRIVRCATTDVDPDTGARDLAIPQTLRRTFGHTDCGVYGEVVEAGQIAVGDAIIEM
jgi:uncharacterized protein